MDGYLLAVADPRRRAVARAVFGTVIAAAVFFAFTVPTKQFAPLYDHAPWENDPFDTVYSFAMFFVPLLVAFLLVQVSLCRKSEPLAISRVVSILRVCRIALSTIVLTLLSCWSSVAVGANRSQWTSGTTVILIAALVVVTGLTGRAIVHLLRAPKLRVGDRTGPVPHTDWLGDVITVAERESHWFGPLRPARAVLSTTTARCRSPTAPSPATSPRTTAGSSTAMRRRPTPRSPVQRSRTTRPTVTAERCSCSREAPL